MSDDEQRVTFERQKAEGERIANELKEGVAGIVAECKRLRAENMALRKALLQAASMKTIKGARAIVADALKDEP